MADELTGDALKQRAKDLKIIGRADLGADELRDRIARAEAGEQGLTEDSPDPQADPPVNAALFAALHDDPGINVPLAGLLELAPDLREAALRPEEWQAELDEYLDRETA